MSGGGGAETGVGAGLVCGTCISAWMSGGGGGGTGVGAGLVSGTCISAWMSRGGGAGTGVGAGFVSGTCIPAWVSGSGGMVLESLVVSAVNIHSNSRIHDCCMITSLLCAVERLDGASSRMSQRLVAIIVVILWFAGWDLMKNQGICFGTNL